MRYIFSRSLPAFIVFLNAALAAMPHASAQTLTEFAADQFGYIQEITAGPDSALWFTSAGNKLGRIPTTATAANSQISAFTGPNRTQGITAGPDGAMWFTSYNLIGRIPTSATVTDPQIITFSPTTGEPAGITVGPDGALWFPEETQENTARIGRIPTTATVSNPQFSFFADPNASYHYPRSIMKGSDGALWFIAEDKNTTASMMVRLATTQGSKPELVYTIPAGYGCGTVGTKCSTTGPDGAIWFVELSNAQNGISKIARISTAARNGNAPVNEYALPAGHFPRAITAGHDGALWFTESPGDNIGRITTSGVITEFPIPANVGAADIATGSDGALWFVESTTHKIARLFPPPAAGQIRYVKVPGPLATSSQNWDAMTGLSLVLPTSSSTQTTALVTLNVPNSYATGTTAFSGCNFAIQVNNTIDPAQPIAAVTFSNPSWASLQHVPTSLVVMVPLSPTGPTTVQAMWQATGGATVRSDTPATLSAVIGSPSP